MAKKQQSQTEAPVEKKCPVTRAQFTELARPITVKIGDETKVAAPKQFSTGSMGWFVNEKVTVMIGDTPVKVQANLSFVVVGSKEAQ